jgi:hypothetical protein
MWFVAGLILVLAHAAVAQPADCVVAPVVGPVVPMGIDIAGRPGAPKGTSGQAYVGVPLGAPGGNACADALPPPRDVLRGEPSSDLLREPDERSGWR